MQYVECQFNPCVGSSGCNTLENWEYRRNCVRKNCSCDIGPEPDMDTASKAPESPCMMCGSMNQCHIYSMPPERQSCMLQNCGNTCQDFFATIPPMLFEGFTPLEDLDHI